MSDTFRKEAFLMDTILAIDRVADVHDAPTVEKRALIAALGKHADEGKWFAEPQGASDQEVADAIDEVEG